MNPFTIKSLECMPQDEVSEDICTTCVHWALCADQQEAIEDNMRVINCHRYDKINIDTNDESQKAKADAGKLQLTLVPTQIIKDIAEVRMYGNKKYGDPDNWKTVDISRYRDAMYRHFLAYLDDPHGVDEESGIPHWKHVCCNAAFISAMETYDK